MAPQHPPAGPSSSAPLRRDAGRDESLAAMLERERTAYACGDYLRQRKTQACPRRRSRENDHSDRQARNVTPDDRTRIVDWCYAIADLCRFDRESVAFAMSAVDRFMSTPSVRQDALLRNRGEYQLLAVAALYVSVKTHERNVPSSEQFSAVSRGTYTAEEIESVELELLHGLGWRMCPPTALQIGLRVLNLMESRARGAGRAEGGAFDLGAFDFLRDEVAYQSQCAVRDYALSVRRPSAVAFASILNAIEQVSDDDECKRLVDALVRVAREYDFDSPHVIAEARDRLRSLVEGVDEQRAEAEDVPEEDTVAGSRHSLDEVNQFEDIQDLYSLDNVNVVNELEETQGYYVKAYYGADAAPAVGYVGDVTDDDADSCATVHY